MEWLFILLIVVPALIALVLWDVQSRDTTEKASPAFPSSGGTRPLLIGLAVLTQLGWGLFLYAKLDDAENRRGARRDILAVTANLDTMKGQLAQQEQTSGSLADLQNRMLAATTRLGEATQSRDQAQAQLASVQKELGTYLQQQTQLAQQIQAQTQELSRAGSETQDAEQRRTAALTDLAAHPHQMADRSQELAEIGRRLEAARQQVVEAREQLTRLAQEIAAKAAEVAQAEQPFQQAREAEASLRQQHVAVRGQLDDMGQQRGRDEQALAAATRTGTSLPLRLSNWCSGALRFRESWPS